MPDGLEGALRRGADALGGRIGRDEIGVRDLELLQRAEQRIVLGIRDLRIVEDVIAVVVVGESATQLGSLLPHVARRPWHSRTGSSRPPKNCASAVFSAIPATLLLMAGDAENAATCQQL